MLPDVLLKARSSRCRDDHWDLHVVLGLWTSSDESRLDVAFDMWAVEADSVGRVRPGSPDPNALPIVEQPFSVLTDHDVGVLLEGIGLARRLARSRALAPFLAEEREPGPVADLEEWVREKTGGYWHPVGTCRMDPPAIQGPSSIQRVVSTGSRGVVVADASIFPTIPRANTNLPTVGAAEYVASTLAVGRARAGRDDRVRLQR